MVRRYLVRPLVMTIAVAVAAAVAAATAAAMAATARHDRSLAAVPACRAAALHLQVAGTDTAVGSTAMTIAVLNRSVTACSLAGYPAVRLVQPNGHASGAMVRPGTGGIFSGAAGAVMLAPEAKASFFFVYRDFRSVTGRPCAPTSELVVRLPGVTGDFTVAAQLAACGPVSVSALRSGAVKE